MKKTVGNIICILLSLVILTGCAGCKRTAKFAADFIYEAKAAVSATSSPATSSSPPKEEPVEDNYSKIEFYNDFGQRESVSRSKIGNYQPIYFKYMSSYYKRQLSQEEQIAYNALLYAMEHNFTNIVIKVDSYEFDFYRARSALALDSPFLEQNFWADESYAEIDTLTMCYTISAFNEDAWNLKIQALNKAEEIVASIPADADSDIERMAYLYDYVRQNVKYSSYEDESRPNYLYDALCSGVTICDGYSNALSLLFNMAGIESCEVMGSSSEDEDAEGHTWVAAPLNGTFYNFDATSDTLHNDGFDSYRCYFGVSDRIMNMAMFLYDDMRPVCNDESRDMIMADGSFGNMLLYETERAAARLCNERAAKGKMKTLLAFEGDYTRDNVDTFINEYIEFLEYGESIEYVSLRDKGRALILITINEF